jgi:hypothetical protein
MTLRIRFPQGRLVKRQRQEHNEVLQAATSLLTPACVMAYVLAFWRLAADIGIAADSGMRGTFSHWQLWVVLGVILQVTSRSMHRKVALRHQVPDRIQ